MVSLVNDVPASEGSRHKIWKDALFLHKGMERMWRQSGI